MDAIENDWAEYIDFGTNNKLVIELQKIGFSREIAKFIEKNGKAMLIEGKVSINRGIFELENELFVKSFQLNYLKSKNIELSILETLNQEYTCYVNILKDLFRIACFTTSPYSQLMWGGSYGNFHKGFCVEYTVLPTDEEYNHLFQNIFPLIYCKNSENVVNFIIDNSLKKS